MNHRGSLTLFKEVFQAPPTTTQTEKRKGRSSSLHDKRNECLLDRYYWHGRREIEPGKTMSYDSLLRTIAEEFFLSKSTVPEVVDVNYDTLIAIKKEWADKPQLALQKYFMKKWPHFVW